MSLCYVQGHLGYVCSYQLTNQFQLLIPTSFHAAHEKNLHFEDKISTRPAGLMFLKL